MALDAEVDRILRNLATVPSLVEDLVRRATLEERRACAALAKAMPIFDSEMDYGVGNRIAAAIAAREDQPFSRTVNEVCAWCQWQEPGEGRSVCERCWREFEKRGGYGQARP